MNVCWHFCRWVVTRDTRNYTANMAASVFCLAPGGVGPGWYAGGHHRVHMIDINRFNLCPLSYLDLCYSVVSVQSSAVSSLGLLLMYRFTCRQCHPAHCRLACTALEHFEHAVLCFAVIWQWTCPSAQEFNQVHKGARIGIQQRISDSNWHSAQRIISPLTVFLSIERSIW